MTLLEAVIAFVLLSVVGIACLDQSRGAAQLQVASVEWDRAVLRGESAMASAVAGVTPSWPETTHDATRDAARDATDDAALPVQVTRRAWGRGVDAIEVTVPLHDGGRYVLSRLVSQRTAGTR